MSCSRTTAQWRRWGSNPRLFGLEVKYYATEPLRSHFVILASKWMLRCSLKFNPQSVIRYQQFALWVKMSIMSSVTDFKNIWLWPLISKSYPYSETFVVIFTWYAIIVANMNMQGQKMKEVITFWAVDKLQVLVTSTFDYQIISAMWNLCFILHTMGQSLCNLEAIMYACKPTLNKLTFLNLWFCWQITLKVNTMETILYNIL